MLWEHQAGGSSPPRETMFEKFKDILVMLAGTEGCINVVKMRGFLEHMEKQATVNDDNGAKAQELLNIIHKFHRLMQAVQDM